MRRAFDAVSRAALGVVFVRAGFDVVRTPGPPAAKAEPVLRRARSAAPVTLPDDVTLVRLNAATHVVAGGALIGGVAPRLAAAALIASLGPTTFGGHRFWEFDATDPQRALQRNNFLKNVSMAGGLLHVLITPRHLGREERP